MSFHFEDIKEKATGAIAKIKEDPQLSKEFAADPVKTLENLLGVDLPDEQVKAVVELIKGKLSAGGDDLEKLMGDLKEGKAGEILDDVKDEAEEVLDGVKDKAEKLLGNMFGKKQ
ncbi:MAG: hypothetical protein RR951_05075 [Ruthenibacterium sp.]